GVPNILVYSPAYYSELNKDFVSALYHSTTPVVVRYPRGKEPYCPEDFTITGNAYDIYGDSNAEYALVTYGRIFGEAAKAYKKLKSKGINIKIIKLNEIIPISTTVYEELENVKKVYFFEEGVKNGGIGETFGSYILENGLSPKFKLVAFPDCFVKQGKVDEILHDYQLDCEGMCSVILKDFGKVNENE
ncbi:MAG: 1-deoxy-D-xylulose-5-phosphate synthase, partial [Clostridia bacterium]|nr:1-deoxy-D-xylulose-5-phosphate synthase [Clostridia bacterium]